MSHEFRTPLNAILGFAEVLRLNRKREPLTPGQDEAVGYILTNGRHLLTQIEAMLDLAQLDSGQPLVTVESLPLAEILDDVRGSFALQAEQAGIALSIDPGAAKSLFVSADRARLGQVIASLVSNGLTYNRAGGEVSVTTAKAGDRIEIAVSDNGAGIAEARIAGIFQPFDRLGREGGAILGSGIALAIGKRLIEAMGGDLRVKSVEGEGSTFTVVLPAAAKAAARGVTLVSDRAA